MADKQGKPIKGKPVKFVRQGEMVYARLTVPRAICIETFQDFEQFGRFMLRDEGSIVPLIYHVSRPAFLSRDATHCRTNDWDGHHQRLELTIRATNISLRGSADMIIINKTPHFNRLRLTCRRRACCGPLQMLAISPWLPTRPRVCLTFDYSLGTMPPLKKYIPVGNLFIGFLKGVYGHLFVMDSDTPIRT